MMTGTTAVNGLLRIWRNTSMPDKRGLMVAGATGEGTSCKQKVKRFHAVPGHLDRNGNAHVTKRFHSQFEMVGVVFNHQNKGLSHVSCLRCSSAGATNLANALINKFDGSASQLTIVTFNAASCIVVAINTIF